MYEITDVDAFIEFCLEEAIGLSSEEYRHLCDVRDVLSLARDRVAAGWCKGHLARQTLILRRMQFCALGAIRWGNPSGSVNADAIRVLRSVLDVNRTMDILTFNDAPSTTQRDVVSAYDAAVDLMDRKISFALRGLQ